MARSETTTDRRLSWAHGVTRYQWLVLVVGSLGWVFDVFEGQIFVASMRDAMPSLLPPGATQGDISYYNNIAFGAFLIGGALGGVLFGALSDRIGRTRTMILTILMYSCFTFVTMFAQTWWQMAALRFLVAMGVGGEWAVASAMVAEVFPDRARAWSGAIFHGSSVLGTYLAVLAGVFVIGNPRFGWRWGFALGALPALLTLWIRWRLREPERWVQARDTARRDRSQQTGRIVELFQGVLLRRTLVGVTLAAVGLATFWGVHIYGKDLMRGVVVRPLAAALPEALQTSDGQPARALLAGELDGVLALLPADRSEAERRAELARVRQAVGLAADGEGGLEAALHQLAARVKRWEMIGMFLVTTGGGLGLLAFGPICEWLGRRRAFIAYHVGGLAAALVLFQTLAEAPWPALGAALPIFGFLTLGMHAGYAVYFPELYPTRLRGTGAGFCFNVGRFLAAPALLLSGWLQRSQGLSLEQAASLMSALFLLALVILAFAPETKGRTLPQ